MASDDPVDGDGIADPFGVRDILRAIDEESEKPRARVNWGKLRGAVEGVPLRYPRESVHAELMSALATAYEELVKGNGELLDESGYFVHGDLFNELADLLIKHVNDVEGNDAG